MNVELTTWEQQHLAAVVSARYSAFAALHEKGASMSHEEVAQMGKLKALANKLSKHKVGMEVLVRPVYRHLDKFEVTRDYDRYESRTSELGAVTDIREAGLRSTLIWLANELSPDMEVARLTLKAKTK